MQENEIYERMMNKKNDIEIDKIEKFLKGKITHEQDIIKIYDLYLMLLIALLQKNDIETAEMNDIFKKFIKTTLEIEKHLKKDYKKNHDFSSKMLLDVFYKTYIYKINELQNLYKNKGFNQKANILLVLKKDLMKNNALFEKEYLQYFFLLLEKGFSNYGTSFMYLLTVTAIFTSIFGFLYQISDLHTEYPYVCGDNCIQENAIIKTDTNGNKSLSIIKEKQLENTDYYMYVSVAIISNLGGDLSQAGSLFLRIIFGIEQILGVILFGILLLLLGKKL